MTRHYNKEKEVGDLWQGPIYPKIRKKLQKKILNLPTFVMLYLLETGFLRWRAKLTSILLTSP